MTCDSRDIGDADDSLVDVPVNGHAGQPDLQRPPRQRPQSQRPLGIPSANTLDLTATVTVI